MPVLPAHARQRESVLHRPPDTPRYLPGFLLLAAVFLIYSFLTNATYQEIFSFLIVGLRLTIIVTIIAFGFAMVIGLITAFGQMSNNIVFRNIAMLYVQIVRGVPVLVLIFYTALVIVPAGIVLLHSLGEWLAATGVLKPDNTLITLTNRDVNFAIRGIIALAITCGIIRYLIPLVLPWTIKVLVDEFLKPSSHRAHAELHL